MALNDRQMQQHVIGLVRAVISGNHLSARPSVADVIGALRLPEPKAVPMPSDKDGFHHGDQIYVSASLTCAERVEFTIFHEILHILLERDGEIPSELHDHFYGQDKQKEVQVLEFLCQVGAAEFVMPSAEYVALMQGGGWRLSAVEDAAGQFGCSVIAAAFGFAHHYPGPCTVLVCEHGYLRKAPQRAGQLIQTQQADAAMCLFVAYSIRNHQQKYPMCRNVPIPRMHLIHQTWLDCGEATGRDVGFFKNGNGWRIHCEVVCIRGRAYAMYLPNGPIRASFDVTQLSLF